MLVPEVEKRPGRGLLPAAHPNNRRSTVAGASQIATWRRCSIFSEAEIDRGPAFSPFLNAQENAGISLEKAPIDMLTEFTYARPIGATTSLLDTLSYLSAMENSEVTRVSRSLRTFVGHSVQEPSEEALRSMLEVRLRTDFEEVDLISDDLPVLGARQAFLRICLLFRRFCRFVTSHAAFEAAILFVIVLNTVLLSQEDMSLAVQPEPYASFDAAFLYCYTVEMGLKVRGR